MCQIWKRYYSKYRQERRGSLRPNFAIIHLLTYVLSGVYVYNHLNNSAYVFLPTSVDSGIVYLVDNHNTV